MSVRSVWTPPDTPPPTGCKTKIKYLSFFQGLLARGLSSNPSLPQAPRLWGARQTVSRPGGLVPVAGWGLMLTEHSKPVCSSVVWGAPCICVSSMFFPEIVGLRCPLHNFSYIFFAAQPARVVRIDGVLPLLQYMIHQTLFTTHERVRCTRLKQPMNTSPDYTCLGPNTCDMCTYENKTLLEFMCELWKIKQVRQFSIR